MENKHRLVLVSALDACETREVLEDTFERFDVSDYDMRVQCMNECMGNPKTFFSSGETPDSIQKYELTVQMFLAGAWRLSKIYKKIRA